MTTHNFYLDGKSLIITGFVRKKTRTKHRQELRFLIDTGAERTVISFDVACNIGYKNHF